MIPNVYASDFINIQGVSSKNAISSIETVEDGALGKCSSLTSIEIPDSVTSIVGIAFNGLKVLYQ